MKVGRKADAGDKTGFVLLGRKEGPFLEVLAHNAEDGKVLCLFETQELAEAFLQVCSEIRGQGWRVCVMATEKLPDLVADFDYVTINPSPQRNSKKELIPAPGFAKSLRRRDATDGNVRSNGTEPEQRLMKHLFPRDVSYLPLILKLNVALLGVVLLLALVFIIY